jgi:hypothetical protein
MLCINNHGEVNNKENFESNQKRKILKRGAEKAAIFSARKCTSGRSIAWGTIQGERNKKVFFFFPKIPPNPRLNTAATFPPERVAMQHGDGSLASLPIISLI